MELLILDNSETGTRTAVNIEKIIYMTEIAGSPYTFLHFEHGASIKTKLSLDEMIINLQKFNKL